MTDLGWQQDAVCAEIGVELFFPEKGENWHMRHAKQMCSQCPVRAECLQYALDNHERFGVWGGLSERQRRVLERGAA
ncbi:WhiB family transcriptional regulator [Amycolatopsis sp. NPDC004368]